MAGIVIIALIVAGLAALGAAAGTWGVDSRDGVADPRTAPGLSRI